MAFEQHMQPLVGQYRSPSQLSYTPSPVSYYDQSTHPLIVDSDPCCSPQISKLFIQFVGDYYFSQNVSQKSDYSAGSSPWAEYVREFSNQPSAIAFVRNLTILFESNNPYYPSRYEPSSQNQMAAQATTVPDKLQRPEETGKPKQFLGMEPEMIRKATQLPKRRPGGITRPDRACQYPECYTEAGFNYPGNTVRKFCSKHKLEGMVSIVRYKPCAHNQCTRKPLYGYPDESGFTKRPLYCGTHKLEGMVMRENRTCRAAGCRKTASCNFGPGLRPLYCRDHKADGMRFVAQKQCEEEGCSISPSFGFADASKMNYCAEHKKPGMICKTMVHCAAQDCSRVALWNFEGVKRGKFCSKHKLDSMVLLPQYTTPTCTEKECKEPATLKDKTNQIKLCAAHGRGRTEAEAAEAEEGGEGGGARRPPPPLLPLRATFCKTGGCHRAARWGPPPAAAGGKGGGEKGGGGGRRWRSRACDRHRTESMVLAPSASAGPGVLPRPRLGRYGAAC